MALRPHHTGQEIGHPHDRMLPSERQEFLSTVAAESTGSIWNWLRLIRRRRGVIALSGLLGILLSLIWVLPQNPRYRAMASVQIQALNEDLLYSKDVSPVSNQGNLNPDIDLATEARMMHTQQLMNRVIGKIKADTNLEVHPPVDRAAAWRKALHLAPKAELTRDQVIEQTAATFDVHQARNSRVMEITFESTDPALAAAFANTLASEYIEQSLETRWETARHTGEWLKKQLDEMKLKLEQTEEQLKDYAARANLTVIGGDKDKVSAGDEKLRELQSELSKAQADRVAKQARYEMAATGNTESLGPVLDDGTLRTYDQKITDLKRELADLNTTLTPQNPKVQKAQAQLSAMENERNRTREHIVDRIQSEYQEALRREKLLAADWQAQATTLSKQAGDMARYNILQRDADTYRQLYESLLQKVKEAGISSALRASNVQIADPATAPRAPFSPDVPRTLLVGLMAGLGCGFCFALVLTNLNRRLEAPEDAALSLGLNVLGVIPARAIDRAAKLSLPPGTGLARISRSGVLPLLCDFSASHSMSTEAFRVLLTSILFSSRRRPLRTIVVTSPGVSEGKTTVASNLAMAFAEANRRVLLIDCDMRRPRLHEVFEVNNSNGLADILAERDHVEPRMLFSRIADTNTPGVSLLPAGLPSTGTANLLHSPRMTELLRLARENFDVVLLDTPPLLQLADARIAGSMADGVMLVVRSGQTMKDAALAARQQLAEDGIPCIGLALNDWNPRLAGYYENEYYYSRYTAEPKDESH